MRLLREQGLGVATFLILEKQRSPAMAAAMAAGGAPPEGALRLFDLIQVRRLYLDA